jgi:hypothetical protein
MFLFNDRDMVAEKGHLLRPAEWLHNRQSSVSASVKAREGGLSAIIFDFMPVGFWGPIPYLPPESGG